MTLEEIKKRIQEIKDEQWDDESAHVDEDRLYKDFVGYVATLDNPSLAEKAKEILKTREIQFSRWCA